MMKVETHGDTIRSSQERISFDDSKEVHPILTDLFTDRSQVPEGSVQVREVLSHLQKNGLRPMTDPRLGEFMRQMSVEPGHPGHADHVEVRKQVSVEEFQAAGRSCPGLLNRALSCSLAIPDFKEFCAQIKSIYEELRHVKGGKNAQYIPQLARVNPDYWGVSVCTVDGQRFSIGDVNVPFCIQSCSKALNYAINVTEHGAEYVHQFLGKEPSGRGFNQIHLDKNGLPHNPMINPGAISCCSVLRKEDSLADRYEYTEKMYKKMAGGEFIGFSNATFLSEKSEADRNFAIGYYLKEAGVFPERSNLKETLDLYFQLCSVEANCDSAAVISATIANGGVCPTTGEVCISPDAVRNTLSLMNSCGMYDYSGEWAVEVGLPSKSGVAGSIFIVIPGVMGFCVWSPPLDELGNSYKGVLFAKKLVELFAFHSFDGVLVDQTKTDPRLHHERRTQEINNLISAALSSDLVELHRCLELGMDFNQPNYDNRTPLHLAVCAGNTPVVKYLIKTCGVEVNPVDRWNSTPLDDAVKLELHELVKFLELQGAVKGADVASGFGGVRKVRNGEILREEQDLF